MMKNRVEDNDFQERIEGRNPVLEALRSGRTVEKIFVANRIPQGPIKEILQEGRNRGIVIQRVDKRYLDNLSETGAHQGVIAVVTPYAYVSVEDILDKAKEAQEPPFVVMLDEITDPQNLGAILRTGECCGAHGVIIPRRRAVGLTATVAKASAGAVEHIPVAKVTNIAATLEQLKKEGLWVAGADMEGKVYTSQDLTGPIALVIGSEGKGLGRLVKEKCDFLVGIPIKGKIDSLNASVAAGILMYEIVRQRGQG
jgi:23S rRNA (guanosine2251-2'-O)-methyltransferase